MASMPLFFVTRESILQDRIDITGTDAAHIVRVLRLRKGAKLLISDMQRNEYTAAITYADPQRVECRILSQRISDTESPYRITLYQAFPKADKLDFVVQKAVELGVAEIVPVLSERCVSRPDPKAMQNRLVRLNRIARAAAEQSGRGVLPVVSPPVTFLPMIEGLQKADLGFACYEGEHEYRLRTLLADIRPQSSIAFFIGPEGGIAESELELPREHGLPAVSLGKRILRTETAGLFVLSAISAILE